MGAPKKIYATVISVTRYSESILEFLFQPGGRIPIFKPGQFLHLAIDPYDPSQSWPESRVFSIANAPEKKIIRIIISVKGHFTRRMALELSVGAKVWLKLPYGNFTVSNSDNPLVLIAGGTGISPYISYLEHCILNMINSHISLYYGVREEKNIIIGSILEESSNKLPHFKYTIFSEGLVTSNNEHIRNGIIDMNQVLTENEPNSLFYISGPPLMIEHFKRSLLDHQISHERIILDEW